ncbi:O-methyltransferase gsfB [Lachnellula suecica]|uniref:O-methyltransferase gsfB n=1 Tax=Lachnellula suecica TaxID=602035 RepID=A0A8T9CC15_9HELO|nr:O-methyltransferase gsfB [Lachnellula suecica]
MASSRITELAVIVSLNTRKVTDYLESNGMPTPSFSIDAPLNLGIPKEAVEIDNARRLALAASIELHDLLQGPSACLKPVINGTSLNAIYIYDIASKLKEDPKAMDMAGLMFDECWQSMARTVDAMRMFKSHEPNQTGHALAHDTQDNMFDWLGKHPEKARRFTSAISTLVPTGRQELFLLREFDWASLGNGTVVDVGGSSGGVSIQLAKEFQDLDLVVQDLPEAIDGAAEKVPVELRPRVKFMEHDFFTDQPVVAEAYLFRAIFHNWPDHYCVKILQKLVPALRHGTMIIINDGIAAEPGTLDLLSERNIRAYDMLMMTLFNARERELDDWLGLFTQADKRFKFIGAQSPDVGTMGVITAIWEDR